MRPRAWNTSLILGLVFVGACNRTDSAQQIASAIEQQLGQQAPSYVSAGGWKDTHEFYARRQQTLAWLVDDQGAKVDTAIKTLNSAAAHGLDPADYDEQAIMKLRTLLNSEDAPAKGSPERAQWLAQSDVRITAALLTLGRDVAVGRTSPDEIDPRWKARRQAPDVLGTLTMAADGDFSTWLDSIKPQHAQYAALQKALADPTMAQHAHQIAVNLERWRWMPDDLGTRHILVNIPSFHLDARDGSSTPLAMKVVVGTPEHKTPVFSDMMTTTVFSPYWNVPDSIVEGETAPAAARDPDFLSRNNIEILRVSKSGKMPVDPSTVKWDDPEELKGLAFRQKPGASNALGHVKFLFPNPYEVYLHDTPADALFARTGRAFSHGCVRVEQPEALAKWVLQDSPEWTEEKITAAMNAGEEEQVKLKQEIPVHIVYFTAWADDAGAVKLLQDVYGYDALQK